MLDTNLILGGALRSNRALAEIKGYADTIPNKNILINAVTINEAKEVVSYRTALWKGYELVKKKQILTINMIINVQEIIEKSNAGVRRLPGTTLKNQSTGEIVYTPRSARPKFLI